MASATAGFRCIPASALSRLGALAGAIVCLAVSAAAQDTTGVGAIRGSVTGAAGGPAPRVKICVLTTEQCAVSDAQGRFSITGVRAGHYVLEITPPDRPLFVSQDIEVRAGFDGEVEITIPSMDAIETTVTVTAEALQVPSEVKTSAIVASSRDIAQNAGALQDVSRYVQSLPGAVIGTNDFRNDIIVRGGSPLENLYVVDNIEIPNINAFANFASAGGTVSVIDALLLDSVTFLTGGYPAPFVNRTSSVMQVALREGSRTEATGRATVGFAGAGLILEGPLGKAGKGSWIVSGRRSFLDIFTSDVGFGGVPVLYTTNAKAVYDLSPRDRVWAVNVSGIDNIRLGLTESSDLTDEISTLDIRYDGWRSATGVNWQRTYGAKGVGLAGVTHSRATVNQRVRDLVRDGLPPADLPPSDVIAGSPEIFREDSSETETTVKYDLTWEAGRMGKVQTGGNVKVFGINYNSASPFGTSSPYFPIADSNPFVNATSFRAYQASAHGQTTRNVTSQLSVTAGARLDHYQAISATRVSPRLGANYALTRRVSVQGAYGRYYQQPFFAFLEAFPQNRSLSPFGADHYIAGITVQPDPATRFRLETYAKRYNDYPVSSQIGSLSLANVGDTFAVADVLFPMVSEGRGRAYGMELLAERKATPGSRWYGQANVSLSRTRHAGLDRVFRPGTYDYPVVANVVAAAALSRVWELSVRVAYLAGRPYTPYDVPVSTAQRRGVFDLTRVNGERAPDYARADVRVDRTFTLNGKPVAVFAGVQNVTNRKNFAGYTWQRRSNTFAFEEQLGVFPILGLDWRF